jgi:hypothetical protein
MAATPPLPVAEQPAGPPTMFMLIPKFGGNPELVVTSHRTWDWIDQFGLAVDDARRELLRRPQPAGQRQGLVADLSNRNGGAPR